MKFQVKTKHLYYIDSFWVEADHHLEAEYIIKKFADDDEADLKDYPEIFAHRAKPVNNPYEVISQENREYEEPTEEDKI